MNPYLSIIIPAFNEADRLGPTLESCIKYLSAQPYSFEIIVVDDGSSDNSGTLMDEYKKRMPSLSVITFPYNQGKGAAVKAGMLAAKGTCRLFMDADNSTSIEQTEKLLLCLEKGYDGAAGSRRITGAVVETKQNMARNLLGWFFRILVRLIAPTGMQDTQNGFKLFSAKAAEDIFTRLKTKSWSFDIEVLLLARSMGYKIKEVPIVWVNDGRSKVRPHQMPGMLLDLIKIRYMSKFLNRSN